MKKTYCVICGKYRKLEKPKISYLLDKKLLVLSIICSKCKTEDAKNFKKEESMKASKILGLINSWFNWKYIITWKIWQKT